MTEIFKKQIKVSYCHYDLSNQKKKKIIGTVKKSQRKKQVAVYV